MIQETKEKLPYMIERLPDFFKVELQQGRGEALQKVMDKLEQALIKNDFEDLSDFPFEFEVMHRVYGFKKDEKKKVFLLLVHLIGQPYFYLTQNIVRQQIFQSFVWILKITGSAFEPDQVQVDWKHIFNMMEQIFLENRYNLQVNADIDKLVHFKHFLSFLDVLKPFFNQESINEIYQKSSERFMYIGMVTLKQFLKITHKLPGETYWPLIQDIFQLWRLRNFKPFEDTFYFIVSSVISRHPQLPWHEHYDFLFSKFYREAIQILPVKDSKHGYVTKSMNLSPYNKFPSTQRVIGQTLANLLLPTTPTNTDMVWNQVVTMFNMLRFLLHPNNQQSGTQKVLQLYYYFLSQFVHRYSKEQMQKKRQQKADKKEETVESEFIELQEEEVKPEKEETQQLGMENIDESALDEEEESDDDSKDTTLKCYITQELIDKVITLYLNDVNHMLYLKEYKERSVQYIIRLLVALSPSVVIAKLLEIIDRAFARQDMKYNTIIEVISSIIPWLLDPKKCPEGLSYLPAILRTLSGHIAAHDAHQSYNIWRVFDIVLQYVPVYDIDDLKKEFKDLDERMPLDVQQLTEDISSIVLEAFRKFLGLFEFLSKKKRDSNRHYRTLFISISNKFYNLIAQSSKSIFQELLRITCEYMQDRLQPHVQQYFAQLLQAFSQREPKITLETFFPLISEKLLKNQLTQDIKHFKFLDPIQYEFQVTHQQTLLYYLSLTEELVGYSHHHCSLFDAELSAIIQLCLQHEEIQVFNQGVKILHQMLLGLVSVHPNDLSFRDDGKIDLNWMQNTSKKFKKSFTVNWWQPGAEDRKYLQTLLNRFYYPIMNYLLTFTAQQNVVVVDFKSYVNENFLEIVRQINEPYCSVNLQIDIHTRGEIYRALGLIGEEYSVIQLRCRDTPQTNGYKRFQDWICFDELNEEVQKIRSLVLQFFPVLVKSGMGSDQKITLAFGRLLSRQLGRHTKDDYNQQLVQVRKWVLQRGNLFKDPISKRTPISRFMKVVLAAYNLNVRMLGIQYMQDKVEEEYVQILLCLGFHSESQKAAFQYLGQLNNTSKATNVVVTNAIHSLLNGSLFSKDELQKVQGSTLQKLGLYQKVIAQVSMRFVDYITHQPEFKIDTLNIFTTLSKAYEAIIDKTFKNQFNLILVKFLEHIFKVIQRKSTAKIHEQSQFLHTELDYQTIYTQRNDHLKTLPYLEDQKHTHTFCTQFVKNTVDLLQQDGNVRTNIVNGLILLFVPPIQNGSETQYLQFDGGVNDVALNYVVSDEFAYRSFGRTLLFRIVRLAKLVNCVRVEKQYTKQDFKQSKTFEQYASTRFFRDEDYESTLIKNSSKKSIYTYYNNFTFNTVKTEELKITLTKVRHAFEDKTYCERFLNGILNDLQANEDNSNLFHQQLTDYSSVFNDVAKYFNSQVNANLKRENLFYKNFTVQYEYLKRLFKKLFQFTEYTFFKNTHELILKLSQKFNDKDNQMLTRLYIMGLLKAVHSKWPLPQDLNKKQIIDFALNIVNQNIETSARDQFFQIQIGLMMVSFDSDSRQLDYLVDSVIQKTKEQTKELLIIRYVGLITSVDKCTGFRGMKYSTQIQETIITILRQTKDSRTVQAVVNLFISQMKDLYSIPTNTTLIKELYNITSIPDTYVPIKNTVYVLPYVENFKIIMEYLCTLLRSPLLEQRKLAFDSVHPLVQLMKYEEISNFQLQYYGGLIQYLLEFKEDEVQNEQISQQFSEHSLHISQLIYDEQAFAQVIEFARRACKSKLFKTRVRVIKFLTHFLYNNIKCDKVQFLEEFSFLLEDEQKLVQDQARNFITTLATTLLPAQQGELVDHFIKKANTTTTELQGKAGLIALIYSLQNLTTSWSNRALSVILRGKSTSPQIKEFASYFQKLYKTNYLSEEQTYPLDLNILEKLAEFASPYNYFA